MVIEDKLDEVRSQSQVVASPCEIALRQSTATLANHYASQRHYTENNEQHTLGGDGRTPAFIASVLFRGELDGYRFGKGKLGVGYYRRKKARVRTLVAPFTG